MLAAIGWSAGPSWFGLSLTVWALAVCGSRLVLGLHRPIEILFGIALGAAFGILWSFLSLTASLGARLLDMT